MSLNRNNLMVHFKAFQFQKEELFFRLAFVDFNGEKVLEAFKKFDGNTHEFIRTNCPSIYHGTNQIMKCINDLT